MLLKSHLHWRVWKTKAIMVQCFSADFIRTSSMCWYMHSTSCIVPAVCADIRIVLCADIRTVQLYVLIYARYWLLAPHHHLSPPCRELQQMLQSMKCIEEEKDSLSKKTETLEATLQVRVGSLSSSLHSYACRKCAFCKIFGVFVLQFRVVSQENYFFDPAQSIWIWCWLWWVWLFQSHIINARGPHPLW